MSDIVFLLLILLGFVVAVVLVWFALNLREKGRAARSLPHHSAARLVTAAFFLTLAIGTGGLALVFIPDTLKGPQYVSIELVAMVFGVPFICSLLLFLLFMRRGSQATGDSTGKPE